MTHRVANLKNGDATYDLTSGDWIVVNTVSQKNLVHKYVGQIISEVDRI